MLMVDDYVCRAPHYRDSWRDHDGQNDNNIDMVWYNRKYHDIPGTA